VQLAGGQPHHDRDRKNCGADADRLECEPCARASTRDEQQIGEQGGACDRGRDPAGGARDQRGVGAGEPTYQREEGELGSEEEHCSNERSARVDRAAAQPEKGRVLRAHCCEAPGEQQRPPDQQSQPGEEPAGDPDERDEQREPVTGRRRVGDEAGEQRQRGQRRP